MDVLTDGSHECTQVDYRAVVYKAGFLLHKRVATLRFGVKLGLVTGLVDDDISFSTKQAVATRRREAGTQQYGNKTPARYFRTPQGQNFPNNLRNRNPGGSRNLSLHPWRARSGFWGPLAVRDGRYLH